MKYTLDCVKMGQKKLSTSFEIGECHIKETHPQFSPLSRSDLLFFILISIISFSPHLKPFRLTETRKEEKENYTEDREKRKYKAIQIL